MAGRGRLVRDQPGAAVVGERAARAKGAAGKTGRDLRHDTRNAAERLVALRLAGHRDACEQPARVRMLGSREQLPRCRVLHHLAGIHHRDAVGDAGDDAEIVGDQKDGEAELLLQPVQQPQDLRLHGDVERGGRLVGDQQLRIAHQRHGDHHPLAQAPRELMRKLTHSHSGRGDADAAHQFDRAIHRLALRRALVTAVGLRQLRTDGVGRVEAGHRLLEDHRHAVAAQVRHLLLRHRQQVFAGKRQALRGPFSGADQQVHHCERADRLAAAGFADDAVGLAAADPERGIAHRRRSPAEGDRHVLERRAAPRSSGLLRAEQAAQAVADEIDAHHEDEQRHARNHDHPGREEHVVPALGDHQSP